MKRICLVVIILALFVNLFGFSASANGENLAKGREVTVKTHIANEKSYAEMDRFDSKILTDGKYGRADLGEVLPRDRQNFEYRPWRELHRRENRYALFAKQSGRRRCAQSYQRFRFSKRNRFRKMRDNKRKRIALSSLSHQRHRNCEIRDLA